MIISSLQNYITFYFHTGCCVILCKGTSTSLECLSTEYIKLTSAVYHQTGEHNCPILIQTIQPMACASNPLEKLKNFVKNKCGEEASTCNIPASDTGFGDSCRGEYAYMELNYLCKPRTKGMVIRCMLVDKIIILNS